MCALCSTNTGKKQKHPNNLLSNLVRRLSVSVTHSLNKLPLTTCARFCYQTLDVSSSSRITMTSECDGAFFSMGHDTLKVPMSLFSVNRERICQRLRGHMRVAANSVVLLQGGSSISLYDTDVDYNVFRQEPFFMWCYGVIEPDCFGLMEVATGEAHLFVPHLPDDYAIWMGRLLSISDYQKKYEIKEVHYVDELKDLIFNLSPEMLLILKGVNSDSGLSTKGAYFPGIEKFKINDDILHTEMSECRVKKTPMEVEVLRYVSGVSSEAHKKVMKFMRPGKFEYQAEAVFLEHCYGTGGCRHVSYTCICGSGTNSAVLHYGHASAPNDKQIKNGDMCLFDMGASYCGYASDITCSFPANGKFTADQIVIYNAVLEARNAVMNAAKPSVSWVTMHRLANRVMLGKLRDAGLLKGDMEEMLQVGVAAIFQPHGLGHLIGLDVHDVGGYLPGHPDRPTAPGQCKLRTARVLEEGMVLTIEPGCYFIDHLIKSALANPLMAKFFNAPIISRFRHFGGVRIEDDVLVTPTGVESLSHVPRTIEEIEAYMSGH